jgi:hypothetical protein
VYTFLRLFQQTITFVVVAKLLLVTMLFAVAAATLRFVRVAILDQSVT